MTAETFARLMARELDPATLRDAERNERIARHALRLLLDRGWLRLLGIVR